MDSSAGAIAPSNFPDSGYGLSDAYGAFGPCIPVSGVSSGDFGDFGQSSGGAFGDGLGDLGDAYGSAAYGLLPCGNGEVPAWLEFAQQYANVTETDKALAWFRMVYSGLFVVLGSWVLYNFYKSRWVLDIRTRSANLVTLAGIAILLGFMPQVNHACLLLWGESIDYFWTSLVLFFVLPIYTGSFIARAVRLAVVFHPKGRRRLPWLIPERNYIFGILLASVCLLALPIYHDETMQIWDIVPLHIELLEYISLGFSVVLAALYPLIRNVDDMFNISKEISVNMVVFLATAVSSRLVTLYGGEDVQRWMGTDHIFIVGMTIVFWVSVVEPMRRLAFDPLADTKRNYADRVLLSRKGAAVAEKVSEQRAKGTSGFTEGESEWEDPEDVWHFERLASTPMLAAAFERFAQKALCQESVLFLAEVSRYTQGEYSRAAVDASVEDYSRWVVGASVEVPSPAEERGQFAAFAHVTQTFICNGAPEEVNISAQDKRFILECYYGGRDVFMGLPSEDRRLIFDQAYKEVRGMLEDNLLQRFMLTAEFKQVRQQRATMNVLGGTNPTSAAWAIAA